MVAENLFTLSDWLDNAPKKWNSINMLNSIISLTSTLIVTVVAAFIAQLLKEEEIHLNEYQDIHEARERIGHFIRQVYHLKRPHSALRYLTPMEFQRQNFS